MLIFRDRLLKSKMLIVRSLTRKLDVEVANNGRGREICFRQVDTHTDDRKFCSLACWLKGGEGLYRWRRRPRGSSREV